MLINCENLRCRLFNIIFSVNYKKTDKKSVGMIDSEFEVFGPSFVRRVNENKADQTKSVKARCR